MGTPSKRFQKPLRDVPKGLLGSFSEVSSKGFQKYLFEVSCYRYQTSSLDTSRSFAWVFKGSMYISTSTDVSRGLIRTFTKNSNVCYLSFLWKFPKVSSEFFRDFVRALSEVSTRCFQKSSVDDFCLHS